MKIQSGITGIIIAFLLTSNLSAQSIHRVACQGNLAKLDSLLKHNPIQVQDHLGRSLLHWAVACEKKEIFDYLVDRGININAEDQGQETPMHIAVRFGREPFFDLLVGLQPNPKWINLYGGKLLEYAVMNKSQTFLTKLLDSGIDIHSVNQRGSTPLEIAKRIGAVEIAEWLIGQGADPKKVRTFSPKGAYMGEKQPDLQPHIFAPNFISTEESEFGSVFNAVGTTFYYGVDIKGKNEIRYSQLINDQWSAPQKVIPNDPYGYNDPFLSPDEQRLYFISKRPLEGQEKKEDQDIWYIEREQSGWSQPINAGTNINSERNEYYISFTADGTMYYSSNVHASEANVQSDYDIYYSKFKDGAFQPAIRLGDSVNTTAYEADVFIAPDESYLIFCGIRSDGLGRGDLYISFKNSDGTWSKSTNMGAPINTVHHELCPYVTADGKYFFYTSNQDIYWVSTAIFDTIRKRKDR